MRISISKGKLIAGVVGVLVITVSVALLAVPDVRNGITQTFKGSVQDTKDFVNGDPEAPLDPEEPAVEVDTAVEPAPVEPVVVDPVPVTPEDVESIPDNMTVTVLNTNGSAVLVQDKGYYALFDGSSGADADVLVKKLKEAGVSKLRYVVSTNYHKESVGGLTAILKAVPTDYILLAPNVTVDEKGKALVDYLDKNRLVWTIPSESSRYKLDKSYFEFVYTHDNGSLLTLLSNENTKILLSSGITRVDEDRLTLVAPQVDAWVFSDKMDGYVTPQTVLDYLKPKNVLIGSSGSVEEPNKTVKAVNETLETTLYTTAKKEDIVLMSNGKRIKVVSELQ